MSIESNEEERTIDGVVYRILPLSADVGHKALLRFVKIAGPVIGTARNIADGLSGPESIRRLLDAISEDDLDWFVKLFALRTTYCAVEDLGKDKWPTLVVSKHFTQRYMQMFDWLRACIEVNFGGFFAEMMSRVKSAAPAKTEESLSQSAELTGSSSD